MMEQVINRVGEGYNISTAIVDTLDSTTITQLLAATGLGRFPIRRGVGPPEPRVIDGNRGTKRGGDARVDKGKVVPKPPAGPNEYRAGMDPCLKYSDGLCNDYNSRGRGCNRPDCRYKHVCRACAAPPTAMGRLLVPSDLADERCGRVGEIASLRFQTENSLSQISNVYEIPKIKC